MTIAFFGHSHYVRRDGDMERVVSLIREIVCAEPVQLFLGGYGKFDDFAYECARSYKVVYGNTHIAFVTPYLDEIYQKNKIANFFLIKNPCSPCKGYFSLLIRQF